MTVFLLFIQSKDGFRLASYLQRRFNNTQKIALITFFSSLYFYSHVGMLYLQERGLNLLQASSIWSIIVGTIFVAEVPTGVIADRIGRKYSVMMAMALQLLGEVLYLFSRSYWAFALIAMIAGVGFAFSSGAVEALIYDTLKGNEKELQMKKAMGLVGMSHQFAFVLAPIAGGFLVPVYALSRFLFAVFLTACAVGVALLVTLTLKEPGSAEQHSKQSSVTILRNGFQQVYTNRLLQWLLLIGVLTASFAGSLVTLYQPYFAYLQIESFWMGMAFAAGALLAGLSERYAYKIEALLGPRWGLWLVTILPGVLYVLFALTSNVTLVIFLFVMTYGTTTLKNPLLSAYQNQLIASENRATVLSLINLVASLYVAVMTLVIGWLADVQLSYAFLLMGFCVVGATILLRVDQIGSFIHREV